MRGHLPRRRHSPFPLPWFRFMEKEDTDLAFCGPTVESSKEEDADNAASWMRPLSMPKGPMHSPDETKIFIYYFLPKSSGFPDSTRKSRQRLDKLNTS